MNRATTLEAALRRLLAAVDAEREARTENNAIGVKPGWGLKQMCWFDAVREYAAARGDAIRLLSFGHGARNRARNRGPAAGGGARP